MDRQAALIIADSEAHSDLFYATKFLAPDPFIFIQEDGKKTLVMSDLEVDRARLQARVDEVLSYSDVEGKLKSGGAERVGTLDVIDAVLKEKGVRRLLVPANFGVAHADGMRARGYALASKPDPFFEARLIKRPEEIEAISATQRAVEAAVEAAIGVMREATVRDGMLHGPNGVLTSEEIKKIIHLKLMEQDCVGQHTIIACGIQGCDPHNEGSGPLYANQSIVMDIFPRSSVSRYYADMSRTVVKGRASDALKRLYDTVLEAQERAVGEVKSGADGQAIHQRIMDRFEAAGYHTGPKDGRMQGFFHGTGHGLGLDIHEPPRIAKTPYRLQTGEVVTVEPGLYYPEIGAVRIEDMVEVKEDGCVNLTRFPKVLEIK
jgi:Xaa-Pro aminopeptidase